MTAIAIPIAALVLGAGMIFIFAFLWGKGLGRGAENKVIRKAFEDAGLSKEIMDEILSEPPDSPTGLFDDWVHDKRDN